MYCMGNIDSTVSCCTLYGTGTWTRNTGKIRGSPVELYGPGESLDPVLVCSIIQDGVRFSSTSHTGESCMMIDVVGFYRLTGLLSPKLRSRGEMWGWVDGVDTWNRLG